MTKWAFCVDNVTAAKVFALVNLVLSVISMIISILKKAFEGTKLQISLVSLEKPGAGVPFLETAKAPLSTGVPFT